MWLTKCDCGNEKIVKSDYLNNGNTKSCGCLQKENLKYRRITHGESKTPLYSVWSGMKDRCSNKKSASYKWYGERGIKVCEEWYNYIPFRDWALSNGYKQGLCIDRIDPNGNYEPSNCQFITQKISADNKRPGKSKSSNKSLVAFGETKSSVQWLNDPRCVVSYWTLRTRLNSNWDVEKALTINPKELIFNKKTHKKYTAFGETKGVPEWAADQRCIVSYNILRQRIYGGWSLEKALTTPKKVLNNPSLELAAPSEKPKVIE